ncbi:MAG: DUF2339 domain-containing protein [Gammaproteobacteria bacterium]|nr:DUF2339 domain-containing protein [Gammaproteobacteria bacterium]
MGWLLTFVGAVLGALLDEFAGLLYGALLGYLLGHSLIVTQRLYRLEAQVARLREAAGTTPSSVEAVASATTATGAVAEAAAPVAAEVIYELDADTPPAPMAAKRAATQPAPTASSGWGETGDATAEYKGSDLLASVMGFFLDGNVVVRVGIVVLFFGVAFLLKYASDHSLLSIEWRLSGAALGALALIGAGWRLRERRTSYALLIQGGGIGLFYLTVYAAAKLYHLLPLGLAFGLMLALVALSALLALLQDARSLAAFGISGGFLAPVLTSTGEGSHVMLFSYYALLNGGILGIAWFKAWRELNLLGFLFTFIIGTAWGWQYYRPEHFATTEPFLILFFLFYVAIAVLFALRQPLQLKGYVDGSLVFGVPIVGFSLQYGLVREMEYGLAFSALLLGFFYVGLALALWRRRIEGIRLLTESFLALGVAFATMAIPLALDGRWTSAAWAMEGAALLWVGVQQQRLLPRLSGLLLQLGAGFSFLTTFDSSGGSWPILNGFYLGTLLLSLAGLFSSFQLQRHDESLRWFERKLHYLALTWGLAWWLLGGLQEIARHLSLLNEYAAALLLMAASAATLLGLYQRLAWQALRYPLLGLLPAALLLALNAIDQPPLGHPLAGWSLLPWLLLFAVQYRLLWRLRAVYSPGLLRFGHSATLWLLLFLPSWELPWQVRHWLPEGEVWHYCAWVVVPLLAMALLLWRGPRLAWPVRRYLTTYLGSALIPVALAMLAWFGLVFVSAADPEPLPYLPLLNPLELTQLLILLLLTSWLLLHRRRSSRILGEVDPRVFYALLGAAAFMLLNEVIAHTIHHWYGVPYRLTALHQSWLFQATLSVVWGVTALIITVSATRLGLRTLWLVGAALLGLVVVKLFFVDLAGSGTIARIVSFIAVGVLMLLTGYFSPMPPRREEERA